MRLFWAGEHTSFLFPSMAHGAFHSGTRAAKDVFTNINVREDDDSLVNRTNMGHDLSLSIN